MASIHTNISFGLVNIPVSISPLISNNDTSFNQLHKKCLHRIRYIKYCPTCKKDIKENEIIKGYEYENDNYITFNKEELTKLKLDNDKEIEVISFVSENEIEPYYYEKSYYLKTESKSKAYYLLYEALKKTKKVAICKTIISSKFYYCVLRLTKNFIIMSTLYFDEEISLPDNTAKREVNQKELDLAIKLISSLEGKFEPEKYKDEYQNKIKQAIDDKLSGKEIKSSKKKNRKQINDLIEALEKSLKKK